MLNLLLLLLLLVLTEVGQSQTLLLLVVLGSLLLVDLEAKNSGYIDVRSLLRDQVWVGLGQRRLPAGRCGGTSNRSRRHRRPSSVSLGRRHPHKVGSTP